MDVLLIGLDDTDNADSPGTGRLARRLLEACAARGMTPLQVTRHQFLVDPRIPYTSHNSAACVAVKAAGGRRDGEFAFDIVSAESAEGSDPGVCVAMAAEVPDSVVDFGRRAEGEVLTMENAATLAAETGLSLRALGGSGQGIIGALAAVGLRSTGNSDRVIDMPALRDLPEQVAPGALERMGIALEHQGPRVPQAGDTYLGFGWVRPRLIGGRAIWPVQWSESHDAWIPVDKRRSDRQAHGR